MKGAVKPDVSDVKRNGSDRDHRPAACQKCESGQYMIFGRCAHV